MAEQRPLRTGAYRVTTPPPKVTYRTPVASPLMSGEAGPESEPSLPEEEMNAADQ